MLVKKQKGAVMIEAAYVLPLILIMILAVVDAVGYAMDSIRAAQVIQDTYHTIIFQAEKGDFKASNDDKLVVCQKGYVDIDKDKVIKSLVSHFDAKSVALAEASVTLLTSEDGADLKTYLLDLTVDRTSASLLELFGVKVHAKGIVTLVYNCSTQ